ncbi:MAG TPA: S8 family serine peptidase [Nitriliruptorales bacterium]|nr:S8 family serine peptidase [Nitriliruptorales bacterium]
MQIASDTVYFEAVLRSERGASMFDDVVTLEADTLDEFRPPAGRAMRAASLLESLGMRVRHVGSFSVSGEAPQERWEEVFGTRVEARERPLSEAHPELGEVTYLSHVADAPFEVPPALEELVERAYPQPPPLLFESPLPPRVGYHHLRVPADVGMILRAPAVHEVDVTGRGVLVAMPDTGFYRHPFYAWHGYSYQATLAPDAIDVEHDEVGHGTAEAANIFAVARDVDLIGVKMGGNATLAFKTASDLHPGVMTNSWGYHLPGLTQLPNFLKPLEAAVIEAVKVRGITVCFSAGNGHIAFPAMMPETLAVGGVHAGENLTGDDFDLQASDYASSFDSQIYPGRHVPDVCGLVGMRPRAVYIVLPVEPGDSIDVALAGGTFPDGDETADDDGWAVISGTSAASPQVAGVCALLKQVQPGLSPALLRSILKASARDVKAGASNNGQPAGDGHDGATGAGLVDAHAAYKLARSVTPRGLFTLPEPR